MTLNTNFADLPIAGTTKVGTTTYNVYVLAPSAVSGVVARFGLVGPRGATYFVTDYGPGFKLNSVAFGGGVSWKAAPRPGPVGLTRDHLAAFYPASS